MTQTVSQEPVSRQEQPASTDTPRGVTCIAKWLSRNGMEPDDYTANMSPAKRLRDAGFDEDTLSDRKSSCNHL